MIVLAAARIAAFANPRARRGATALEFAFVLPLLTLFLVMAADYTYLALIQHQLGYAARAAARYGITGQSPVTNGNATTPVRWCDGAAPADNPRITRIRQIIAENSFGVLKPSGLCLAILSYSGYQSVGKPEPYSDINGNGRWDAGEPFNDVNGNGQWDADQGAVSAGGGSQVTLYTLNYTTHPLIGLTPGLSPSQLLVFNASLPVRNEPF